MNVIIVERLAILLEIVQLQATAPAPTPADVNNTQSSNGRTAKRPQCYSCGGFGHFSRECRNGQKCYNCGEHGHLSKDCTESSDKVCYICKQPGHISTECTNK